MVIKTAVALSPSSTPRVGFSLCGLSAELAASNCGVVRAARWRAEKLIAKIIALLPLRRMRDGNAASQLPLYLHNPNDSPPLTTPPRPSPLPPPSPACIRGRRRSARIARRRLIRRPRVRRVFTAVLPLRRNDLAVSSGDTRRRPPRDQWRPQPRLRDLFTLETPIARGDAQAARSARPERASTCRRAERARRMSAKCARGQRHGRRGAGGLGGWGGGQRGRGKGRRNNVLTAYCQRACRTCRVCPSLSNGPPERLALWSARQSRDKGSHESAGVTLSLSLSLSLFLSLSLCRYDDRTIVSMRPFLRGYGTLMALFLPACPLVVEHSLDR